MYSGVLMFGAMYIVTLFGADFEFDHVEMTAEEAADAEAVL